VGGHVPREIRLLTKSCDVICGHVPREIRLLTKSCYVIKLSFDLQTGSSTE
jgi:hypothetical protein